MTLRGGSLLLSANGCSLFTPPTPSIHFNTDASGSWGFGAIWQTHWFKAQWPDNWIPLNIATKELLPIVLASIVWRRVWSSKHVRCHSDNSAVVQAINICTVKDHNLLRLLRCLFFVEAQFNFRITAAHINGSINTAADMLSRNNIANFFPTGLTYPHSYSSSSTGHTTGHQCRLVHWSSRLRDTLLSL